MRTGTRPMTGAATVVLVLALAALAACGGGGGDDDSVASLDGSGTEDDTGNDSAGGGQGGLGELSPAFEDAMLEYAQCMRDQGVDFRDPQFDEGGGIVVGPRQGTGSGPPSEAD